MIPPNTDSETAQAIRILNAKVLAQIATCETYINLPAVKEDECLSKLVDSTIFDLLWFAKELRPIVAGLPAPKGEKA